MITSKQAGEWFNPLFDYHATTITRAFLLNSFAVALIVTIAHIIQRKIEPETRSRPINWSGAVITFFGTWLAAILVYGSLNFLFGYGGGMITAVRG